MIEASTICQSSPSISHRSTRQSCKNTIFVLALSCSAFTCSSRPYPPISMMLVTKKSSENAICPVALPPRWFCKQCVCEAKATARTFRVVFQQVHIDGTVCTKPHALSPAIPKIPQTLSKKRQSRQERNWTHELSHRCAHENGAKSVNRIAQENVYPRCISLYRIVCTESPQRVPQECSRDFHQCSRFRSGRDSPGLFWLVLFICHVKPPRLPPFNTQHTRARVWLRTHMSVGVCVWEFLTWLLRSPEQQKAAEKQVMSRIVGKWRKDLLWVCFWQCCLLLTMPCVITGKPTPENHPPKYKHSLRKQFRNSLCKLSPFSLKIYRNSQKEFAQTVCANSFFWVAGFSGGSPSLDCVDFLRSMAAGSWGAEPHHY